MTEQRIEQNLNPEPQSEFKPAFETSIVKVLYLSDSPKGFEVKTNKISRRREKGTHIPLDQGQREQLKRAMANQLKFAEGDRAKQALDKLRNSPSEEAREDFEKKRKTYVERAKSLVGVRNLKREGNTLTIDVHTVDYQTFQQFSSKEASLELLDLAVPSSTSIGLITADNRLIIQHRSSRNAMWGDVPGASVAGYMTGDFDPKKRGAFLPVDTNSIIEDSEREASEELGLEKSDFSEIKIVAFTSETEKIQDEFALVGKSNLTAEEIREKAKNASENIKLSEEEFREKFVDAKASPETIVSLLTEVKCPLPPAHLGLFAVLGYSMMVEKFGIEKANMWIEELQIKTQKNYDDIDKIVEQYYLQNPKELENVPERYKGKNIPPRNPKGYSPSYLPKEQGLPDFTSELQRVNLI